MCTVKRIWPVTLVLALTTAVGHLTPRSAAQDLTTTEGFSSRPFEKVVPYVPTPPEVVEKMLELAQVTKDDIVYDLGSGDGRIVIMAAQKFGAQAVGIEMDPELYKKSSAQIEQLGLEKRARIIHGNMFEADVRRATVVTLYLLTSVNDRLRPILEKQLRPGTRVVSHDFQMAEWKPEKTVNVITENGITHTIYLYVRP